MKKKIFFVASFADSLINFRLQLMQSFVTNGYEVVALAPQDWEVSKYLNTHSIRFLPIPLERNGTNPIADLKLFFALKKIMQVESPDILFSYAMKPVIYASLAANNRRVSQIYSLLTGTGYAFSNVNLKGKLIGWIVRRLLKKALSVNTKVFFQNPDNLNLFRKEKILSKKTATAVVNGSGVDCNYFSPVQYPKEVHFLMIARLLRSKGVNEYVEAAKRIKKRFPNIKFFLVGWIDTNPESISQKELDTWIEEGHIEFLGKLNDVRDSIKNSSVYVLPSWYEGTPRTVLEAMAMARPIITTDAPGCRETVIPNYNGFLVPTHNVEKLCHAMEYFLLNPEKISVMGEASRKIAVEKYDVDKVNRHMMEEMAVLIHTETSL